MTPERRFAVAMRQMRERSGYSQEGLAGRLREHGESLHLSAISKMETGSRMIRLNEAAAVAAVLGFQIWDVLDSSCQTCMGSPPRGFRCNECGSAS